MKFRAVSKYNMSMHKDMCRMPAFFARKCARKCGNDFNCSEYKKKNTIVSGTVFALTVQFFVFARGIYIIIISAVRKSVSAINDIIQLISEPVVIHKNLCKCPNILEREKCR